MKSQNQLPPIDKGGLEGDWPFFLEGIGRGLALCFGGDWWGIGGDWRGLAALVVITGPMIPSTGHYERCLKTPGSRENI